MAETEKKIVFGMLAHVDSGKTTLSEAILYKTGVLRRPGRVDHGDAFLDTHTIERGRGITIFSKQACFSVGGTDFTLLDTPGHTDFWAETERTLRVLDYAVLIVSGTDGVDANTETLWRLLEKYEVPVFIFVNKMDLSGASRARITDELHSRFGDSCIAFDSELDDEFYESVAMCGEELLEQYLESGSVSDESINYAVSRRRIFPCFFGSALKLDGVDALIEALSKRTVMPKYGDKFAARVFKVSEDKQGNRLTHLKITGGVLRVRDELNGIDRGGMAWTEKVNQIRVYSGEKFTAPDAVTAGTVCEITGLSKTYPGEGLGAELDTGEMALSAVMSYTVELPSGTDTHTAYRKLKILEEEEPLFSVVQNGDDINMRLMGRIQTEVLKQVILDRFGLDVSFKKSGVAYRETIRNTVLGVGHYEPLRHYAEVHLILEPLKPGSGIRIESKCSEDKLDKNFQRLILTHLNEKTHIGVLTGSPIMDIKITLVSGRAHKKHTEGGDFRQATYRAVRQGLRTAESVLLEPWYDIRLEIPPEHIGRAISDVQRMGGETSQPQNNGERAVICGSVPVAAAMDYPEEVTAYTSGSGSLSLIPCGYRPCAEPEAIIEEIAYDADSDLDNTADSVFCSHGAGVSVKWNEVYEHMHLENELAESEAAEVSARAREYVSRMVTDKELMQIFERTYGQIKRSEHTAMKTVKRPKVNASAVPRKKSDIKPPREYKNEYLLVDGYNIIFAWDRLKKYAEDDLDTARVMLMNILCNYQGFTRCRVILVFDAYKVKDNPGEVEKYHNITVVYTKEKETADSYIEKAAYELSRNNRVRVATSDSAEQIIILGGGALRVSAREFLDEITSVENAIRNAIDLSVTDEPLENELFK